MSNDKSVRIQTLSDLDSFCKKFVLNLEFGTIIILSGKLGAGKTTFTKYLAKYLGVKDEIVSPTFALERVYKMQIDSVQGKFVHIDAYRFGESEERINDTLESLDLDYFRDDSIIVVEWGEKISQFLDGNIIAIEIIRNAGNTDDETRILNIEYKKEECFL
jgi:tRNA threonylcarbamoyladenosine biosynthesis protein TsaE